MSVPAKRPVETFEEAERLRLGDWMVAGGLSLAGHRYNGSWIFTLREGCWGRTLCGKAQVESLMPEEYLASKCGECDRAYGRLKKPVKWNGIRRGRRETGRRRAR